jgi:glucokinase
MNLLVGDVGGTKTSVALYSSEAGARNPVRIRTFASAQYPSLEEIARTFLEEGREHVDLAVFGVAGPVLGGTAKITNLPWEIDAVHLATDLGLQSVTLLNDLEAIAFAVPHLRPDEVRTVNEGRRVQEGPLAVIAPGTGLGEAFLTWDSGMYRIHASEGGHTDFGPTDERQLEMLRYLLTRFDHVSYERVCSGIGLPNIYAFLRDTGFAPEPAWLSEKLRAAHDPTPVIMEAAQGEHACDLGRETLRMFVQALGAETGNLALKVMATGGIFLGGGIPPRILPALEGETFRRAFLAKGRFNSLLEPIPVHVILNPGIALFGAACAGFTTERDAPRERKG